MGIAASIALTVMSRVLLFRKVWRVGRVVVAARVVDPQCFDIFTNLNV
jgi:hypothetical protein